MALLTSPLSQSTSYRYVGKTAMLKSMMLKLEECANVLAPCLAYHQLPIGTCKSMDSIGLVRGSKFQC